MQSGLCNCAICCESVCCCPWLVVCVCPDVCVQIVPQDAVQRRDLVASGGLKLIQVTLSPLSALAHVFVFVCVCAWGCVCVFVLDVLPGGQIRQQ